MSNRVITHPAGPTNFLYRIIDMQSFIDNEARFQVRAHANRDDGDRWYGDENTTVLDALMTILFYTEGTLCLQSFFTIAPKHFFSNITEQTCVTINLPSNQGQMWICRHGGNIVEYGFTKSVWTLYPGATSARGILREGQLLDVQRGMWVDDGKEWKDASQKYLPNRMLQFLGELMVRGFDHRKP